MGFLKTGASIAAGAFVVQLGSRVIVRRFMADSEEQTKALAQAAIGVAAGVALRKKYKRLATGAVVSGIVSVANYFAEQQGLEDDLMHMLGPGDSSSTGSGSGSGSGSNQIPPSTGSTTSAGLYGRSGYATAGGWYRG